MISSCSRVCSVLRELESNDLNYVHWKSNEHLDKSVTGLTDLDILFDYEHYEKIVEILLKQGFKRYNAPCFKQYPFIEDFVYINPEQNTVVHIHAHFKLIVGETNVKNYHLNWESHIFKNRIYNKEYSIYTISPEYELLLLIVRVSLKENFSRKYGIRRFLNSSDEERKNSEREFAWLKERIDFKIFEQLVLKYFDMELAAEIIQTTECSFFYDNIKIYSKKIREKLKNKRRKGFIASFFIENSREIRYFSRKILNKTTFFDIPVKRIINDNEGGIICTIVGVDGAGKTTISKELCKILSKKFDVRFVYMGSGKGDSSILRTPLNYLRTRYSQVRRKKGKEIKESYVDKEHKSIFSLRDLFNIIWAVTLLIERNTRLNRIRRLKNRGFIVVTDRYPQINTLEYNDGPLLQKYADTHLFFFKYLAQLEMKIFRKVQFISPNIVIKLSANVDVIRSRRPEMTSETIERKIIGLEIQDYGNKDTIVRLIDTSNKSIKDTISLILAAFNECINNRK